MLKKALPAASSAAVPLAAELQAPASWRTVDFISDLHLQAADTATFEAWQHYLESTPADAVFILGDLFEVWVGDDAAGVDRPRTATLAATSFEGQCARLLGQTSGRLALFFMHGNRDFLVGNALMDFCGATLLADPTVLVFDGGGQQRWLLSHGDALCLDDEDYMRFRQQVRSTPWQQDFLARPLAERQQLARAMRQQSQQQHERRAGTDQAYADVDAAEAKRWLTAAGARTLIHGHTHRPAEHALGAGLQRVVLSDWHADSTSPRADVLRLSAGGLKRIALL